MDRPHPGRGGRQARLKLIRSSGFAAYESIVVEVGTRRLDGDGREIDLAAALAFARLHFAAVPQP